MQVEINGKKVEMTTEEFQHISEQAKKISVERAETKGRIINNNVDISEAVWLKNDENEVFCGLTQEKLQKKYPRFARE